jgi:uncharacterized protein YjbI with pentapeptide repeats
MTDMFDGSGGSICISSPSPYLSDGAWAGIIIGILLFLGLCTMAYVELKRKLRTLTLTEAVLTEALLTEALLIEAESTEAVFAEAVFAEAFAEAVKAEAVLAEAVLAEAVLTEAV